MAKLRIRVDHKAEGRGGLYALDVTILALTTDAGAPIGRAHGHALITGLTAQQVAGITVDTEFNCPVQP
jgi:hypothetical protein